jgi:hypothetical protein
MYTKVALLLSTLVFAGCVLPPEEAPHYRELTGGALGLSGVAAEPAADDWWESF